MTDAREKEENGRPEKTMHGVPYMWKGFLSNTTPFTHDIFKTKNIIKISMGSKHCAFLTAQRSVYTYGSGEYGQLGHKKFTDVTKQPVLVQELKSENIADVVCGSNHTGVVCEDGIVFCWGDSTNGQCGIGVSEKINIPTQVHISDADCDPVITQIACGENHTLVVSSQGEMWSWGTGPQLGLATGSAPVLSPKKVTALSGRKVLQAACGGTMSMVLMQRVRSLRSPGNKSNEPEDEGSGSSLTCQDTVYTMHDEGDTVIISDNSMLAPETADPISRSISPDSIDVAAIQAQQAEWTAAAEDLVVEKKRRDRGSTSSQGSSEGTYTLEDTGGQLKRIKEESGKVSEENGSRGSNGHTKIGIRGGCSVEEEDEEEDDVFGSSKGTKELLAEQLKPLTLRGSPGHGAGAAPPAPRPSGPSTRILASLPQSVAIRLEKIMAPRTSVTETVSRTSSDNSICETELIIRDKDAQLLDSSLNLPVAAAGGKGRTVSPLIGGLDDLVYQTEVWSFGKGTMGQLGQGDTLDKHQPGPIKQLSSKNIVRIVAGASHCVAISSNGQVYTWGCNSDGQLGHTGQLVPKRVKMPNNTLVWDAAVGGTHTLLLADGTNCMPDVYYLGKQPSLQELRNSNSTPTPESPLRDGDKSKKRPMSSSISKSPTVKYAARAKQPEKLTFLKKNGWLQAVAASSDQCACIADKSSSGFVAILHEFSATERLLYSQLASVKSSIVKTLQSAEVQKLIEGSIYSEPLRLILELFGSVCGLVAQNCLHLTGLTQRSKELWDMTMLKEIGRYIQFFQEYANAVCDFVTITGFTHLGKVANDALSKHDSVFAEVLNEDKPTVFGAPLRMAMKLPLDRVKTYSYLLTKLKEYYPEDSGEYSLLGDSSALWEELKKTVEKKQADADDTREFWESCPAKLAEAVKSPDRRLIRDSRNKPLQLDNAKRLSTHWFLLFNDIFVHAYFSNHQIFSLGLVWAEPIPDSDQVKNALQLNMPEETMILIAPSPGEKAEWLWSINQAIDVVLTANQKSPPIVAETTQRDGPFQKVPPKRTRQGRHVFMSAGVHKDAVFEGTWLNGKCHGKGTLRWPNGRKYTGQFVHGLQHGPGVLTIPGPDPSQQEVFEGHWLEGKMHGVGVLRYQNGDVYEGDFQDGVRHGHGTFNVGRGAVQDIYIGNWRNGKRHGYGVIDDHSRGEKYMGMWQDDHRQGNGLVITLDGVYYEGVFTHNKLSGCGVLVTEDGTCYEGELATGPTLNGKGILTMPNGDILEGTFNGLWGDGVKINGTFSKGALDEPVKRPCAIGRHTVAPDHKWEDVFGQCRSLLGFVEESAPESHKAWEAVAVALSSGHRQQDSKEGIERRISIEGLERIPTHNRGKITQADYRAIEDYLTKAFDHPLHPLGRLVDNLVNVYRATYIGVGAHHWLLPYAVTEIHSYVKRLYNILRVLFPDLPSEEPRVKTPVVEQAPDFHYYYDYGDAHPAAPHNTTHNTSREKDEDDISHQITSEGLLHPTLLPRLYPVIFTLYALRNEKEDERYRDRLARLNKQSDLGLMAYLGVDQKFWHIEETMLSNPGKLTEIKDASFLDAVESLQNLSTTFCPIDKLRVIEASFEGINSAVNVEGEEDHIWSMDDLFPVFQYVVIRARIPHLGSEIQFIDDMMDPNLIHGKLGIMFTTLKACYMYTKNDNLKSL